MRRKKSRVIGSRPRPRPRRRSGVLYSPFPLLSTSMAGIVHWFNGLQYRRAVGGENLSWQKQPSECICRSGALAAAADAVVVFGAVAAGTRGPIWWLPLRCLFSPILVFPIYFTLKELAVELSPRSFWCCLRGCWCCCWGSWLTSTCD